MKCPQCLVRNSVAATQCKDCGTKFSRKGIPKPLILGGVGVVAVLGLAVAAFSIVPAAFDPEVNLQKIAKRVAAGPKSGSDAEHIKAELESTTKDFLEKDTKLSTADLTAKLQKIFPNSAFETRAFDLPRDLRLVEIDTMLQATDYLISGKHVAVLRNFEVFETAKVVPDGVGTDIVLLGHRNAQAGHRPQVRVFALLPDGVADRTQESVPPISGDGNAVFATNGRDINLDFSLMSKASEERLFTIDSLSKGSINDETVKSKLTLKNGKYDLVEESGRSPFAALRASAFVLADPSAKDRFKRYFTEGTLSSATSLGQLKVDPPLFTVKKIGSTRGSSGSGSSSGDGSSRRSSHHRSRHSRHHHDDNDSSSTETTATGNIPGGLNASAAAAAVPAASYTFLLNNAQDAFEIAMARRDGRYLITSVRRVKATNEDSDMVVETKPTDAASKKLGTTVATAEAGKGSKVVTKMDDFGTRKTANVDNANLSDKVVIKEASKESASDAPVVDNGKKASSGTNKGNVAHEDRTKLALVTPSATTGADDNAKNGSADRADKNTVKETGVISTNDSTPSIKLRRGASTTYRAIGELKRGASVQIIGKQDDWYKVQADGKIGYVYNAYVSTKSHASSAGPSQTASVSTKSSPSKEGIASAHFSTAASSSSVVIKRTRNLRDEQHRKIGLAEAGNKVVVIGTDGNGKYKVRLSNGVIGYVDREAFDGVPAMTNVRAETKLAEKTSTSSSRSSQQGSSRSSEKASAKSSSKSRESSHHKSHKSTERAIDNASEIPQMVP
jgi:uncharacterized protein YgiM (DUF1202 family)